MEDMTRLRKIFTCQEDINHNVVSYVNLASGNMRTTSIGKETKIFSLLRDEPKKQETRKWKLTNCPCTLCKTSILNANFIQIASYENFFGNLTSK